ncbi:EI24 domain-containing protein [Microbacterium sp. zg.Y909]|uniref:EI24 domain-containing protein n=1 Tax=Microbacterium sp. zg.Y909 TaxID=2969413 RepID=UPI00214BE337|nr:EI24 domain-containing protein [Microbacterium sp. zg.Y909]MCR2826249.1 EI24 domain-containing protein [Microbacterium sp. zg.Y909]
MRELTRGLGDLARGFGLWRRRPGLMAWGLVPAAIVGALFLVGLVTLVFFLPSIAEALTPFADGWPAVWTTVVRVAAGTAVFAAALVVVAVSFTALTLIVGEPFYDRIWRAVESETGSEGLDAPYGFWRSAADSLALIARGLGIAVLAALGGLVPLIGGPLGAATGIVLTGWLLADELTARALAARGIDRRSRRRLLRTQRGRALGFGIATQLCFLVPLGAVAVMPAAVAGSTMLAQSLLSGTASRPASDTAR